MDDTPLARLRARYTDARLDDLDDPLFRRVARAQSPDGRRRKWPFAGVPTLLGAPLAPGHAGLDIALIGVPFDLGVTNRAGTRLGPRAVRNIERIGPIEPALRTAPFLDAAIADIGDAELTSRFSLEQCHADIEAHFARLHADAVRPLAIGGDHSMTLPILRALGKDRPLGMVHIDAHGDTGGATDGTPLHHGAPFRKAVLDGVLDPTRTIQIGLRGGGIWLSEFSLNSGMTIIEMHEVDRIGLPAVIAKAQQVAQGPVYLTFDIDSLDPAYAPGTGTPEPGGFTPREAQALLRGLDGLDIVAADVVEVAPQYDATTNTAQAAAHLAFTILALLTRSPSFRRRTPA
jgi:agmatinase